MEHPVAARIRKRLEGQKVDVGAAASAPAEGGARGVHDEDDLPPRLSTVSYSPPLSGQTSAGFGASTQARTQSTLSSLQADRLLLISSTLTDPALPLSTPCRTLRNTWLNSDWTSAFNDRISKPAIPFPLVSRPDMYKDWMHFLYRLRACQIDALADEWHNGFRSAIDWYRELERLGRISSSDIADLTMSRITHLTTFTKHSESMPAALDFQPEGAVSEREGFICLTIGFFNPAVQEAWFTTCTPHTPVVLFDKTADGELTIYIGYTLPKTDVDNVDNNQGKGAGTGKGGQKSLFDMNITLRLSNWVYAFEGDTTSPRLVRRRTDTGALREKTLALRSDLRNHLLCGTRLDHFLMHEETLLTLARMPESKQEVLFRPIYFCTVSSFDQQWQPDQADAILTDFTQNVEPYCIERMAPQQLRVLMAALLQQKMQCLPGSAFSILPVVGPPGTGKTATADLYFILSKSPLFLIGFLELLEKHDHSHSMPLDWEIPDLAKRMAVARSPFTATTNRAVDEGCRTLNKHVAALKKRKEEQPDLPIDVDSLPIPLRFCDWDKAQASPETISCSAIVRAAGVIAEEQAQKVSEIVRQQQQRKQQWDRNRTLFYALLEAAEGRYTAEEWKVMEPGVRIQCDADAQRLEPASSRDDPVLDSAREAALNTQRRMQDLVSDSSSYARQNDQPPKKQLARGDLSALLEKTSDFLGDHRIVPFFTAGYMNCYHEEIKEYCSDAIILLDEASQAPFEVLVAIIHPASSLILLGDYNQLGPTIKAPIAAVPDFYRDFFAELEWHCLNLTLGLRLHPIVSEFLERNVYQNGYFFPTGQNMLRWSPLHSRRLFAPVVILDIPDSREYCDVGSTSRKNDAEAYAAYLYLREYMKVAEEAGIPARDVALISPYKAQVGQLQTALAGLPSTSAFRDIVGALIDTIQGATTDIGIISLVCAKTTAGADPNVTWLTPKRLTVPISRARFHLVLIANVSAILAAGPSPLLNAILVESSFGRISLSSEPAIMAEQMREAANAVNASQPILPMSRLPCNAPTTSGTGWHDKGEGSFSTDAFGISIARTHG